MFKNLCQRKGDIFICGALHANNLVLKFAQAGLQETLFYYAPHSQAFYDKDHDGIALLLEENNLVKADTHLLNENEVRGFCKTHIG